MGIAAQGRFKKTDWFCASKWLALGRIENLKQKIQKKKIPPDLFERNLDLHVLWDAHAHDRAERPFIARDVNHALVYPHFPVLICVRAVPAGGAARANGKAAGGKGNRPLDFHACRLRDFDYLLAYLFEVFRRLSNQFDSCLSHQYTNPCSDPFDRTQKNQLK
jgi:hypothetical protein